MDELLNSARQFRCACAKCCWRQKKKKWPFHHFTQYILWLSCLLACVTTICNTICPTTKARYLLRVPYSIDTKDFWLCQLPERKAKDFHWSETEVAKPKTRLPRKQTKVAKNGSIVSISVSTVLDWRVRLVKKGGLFSNKFFFCFSIFENQYFFYFHKNSKKTYCYGVK